LKPDLTAVAPHDRHADAFSSAVTTCTTRAPSSSTSTRSTAKTLQVSNRDASATPTSLTS
jgi:hypothetical protein